MSDIGPGTRVECIKDIKSHPFTFITLTLPIRGSIYTVRELSPKGKYIRLHEIINKPSILRRGGLIEGGFHINCFRPINIRDTDITVFRDIVAPYSTKELV